MNKSESIANLAAALSKAQGQIKGATKDTENKFFTSKYADLASVWEACRSALSSNELSVIQVNDYEGDVGLVIVETILSHSSGEWIMGKLAMRPKDATPQSIGSCITYARRYALSAMVGVAPEDDDGNGAEGIPPGAKPFDRKAPQKTAATRETKDYNAPYVPPAPQPDPEVEKSFYEDDALLKMKECATVVELTKMFNSIPGDYRRPGTKVFTAFKDRREELMTPANDGDLTKPVAEGASDQIEQDYGIKL